MDEEDYVGPDLTNEEYVELLRATNAWLASQPDEKEPGRNEPCLCGSGKKWKKCCMDKPRGLVVPWEYIPPTPLSPGDKVALASFMTLGVLGMDKFGKL